MEHIPKAPILLSQTPAKSLIIVDFYDLLEQANRIATCSKNVSTCSPRIHNIVAVSNIRRAIAQMNMMWMFHMYMCVDRIKIEWGSHSRCMGLQNTRIKSAFPSTRMILIIPEISFQ